MQLALAFLVEHAIASGAAAAHMQMVAGLSRAAGSRTGELRDALRELLGDIRIGVSPTGRPVVRFGLHVRDGSGGPQLLIPTLRRLSLAA